MPNPEIPDDSRNHTPENPQHRSTGTSQHHFTETPQSRSPEVQQYRSTGTPQTRSPEVTPIPASAQNGSVSGGNTSQHGSISGGNAHGSISGGNVSRQVSRSAPRKMVAGSATRRANQTIRRRTMWMMVLFGVVSFVVLFWKLYDLQINRHEDMQARASRQQTRSVVVNASRGSIYDRNGFTMAVSATAETVNISPQEIAQFVEQQRESITQSAASAAKRGEDYTPPRILDQAYIARGLSRILGVDQSSVEKRMEKTWSQYETILKKAEREVADEVRRFINGLIDEEGNELTTVNTSGKTVLLSDMESSPRKLQGVWLQPDAKRYYPYSSLAANVVGFVNADNIGGVGLESRYEKDLEGVSGMTVTAKNANGTDLLYQFEQYYEAQDGCDLVLTIDVTAQSYLEKGIRDMLERYDAANGGTGIIMDVNSGAIIAMASYPNYDLNAYGMVFDPVLEAKLENQLENIAANRNSYATEEEYAAARSSANNAALATQWRNKCVDSTYEPGSTFKPITLASAIEEGTISENDTFYCSGSVQVGRWTMRCSSRTGHGSQTLEQAVGNSCNPAFIHIAQSVGPEKYYQYLKSFGLMDRTGVDMIGETSGIFASEQTIRNDPATLASYSFGQTFNVTPVELIRAQAACINGGYLYTPYVVEQVLNADGSIRTQHDASPVRQVISAETSALVRECLEYVVAQGTGKNGQVSGYRIGGKTGTADKTGTRTADNPQGDVVVSFMCFAPADDPKYIMLLTMDTPSRNTGVYVSGGNMVAPTASQIMADVLPYLGIEPEYTLEELARADAAVPNVVGRTLDEARERIEGAGFSLKTVGDGDTVTDQTPAGGAIVPNDAQIVLYMGENKPDTLCTVPDVSGMTVAQTSAALRDAGLILRIAGTSDTSAARAISQDKAAGGELAAGSVVTVQFGDGSVLD